MMIKKLTSTNRIYLKNIKWLGVILLALAFNACKRDFDSLANLKSLDDLKVPSGFKWENSRNVDFTVSVNDLKFLDDTHLIAIYDKDPSTGGQLLAKGSATLLAPFQSSIYLASTLKEVYIIKTAPDNTNIGQKVEVKSTKVDVTITNATATSLMAAKKMSAFGKALQLAEADCSSGCTQTITTNNTNINVNNGDVICVTADNITVGFNANGGTVRICGKNVTVQNANLNNTAKLIVSSSGIVTFGNLNINGSSASFENYGTATTSSSFSTGGVLLNNGTFKVNGDMNLNQSATLTNNSVIQVTGSVNISATNETNNYNSLTIGGDLRVNNGAKLSNYCKITSTGNLEVNGLLNNHSFVKVDKTTNVNGGSTMNFFDGSMLSTLDLNLNGSLIGAGETSLVKVGKKSVINGGAVVKGTLQYCDEDGIETNYGKFTNGAKRSCSAYIPKSDCNTEGNGKAEIQDKDNDGISDLLDEYPEDKDKAFNNYYPSSATDAMATLAFEDNWPTKGDYDLNDVVISYRYKIVTNAANKVVQVNGDYLLKATGGGFANGFAVEFPLKASQAKNVTGGTLEAGQENAVVVLFQNMRNEMENWNTKSNDATSQPVAYHISFDDMTGTLLKDFGLGVYNPFIFNNTTGFGRGYEIHLPGLKPTSLADASLFGTKDDDTNVGANKFYLTDNQLPWVINIPINNFEYPLEEVNIFKAYSKFTAWAQSGGTKFTDWYVNQADGYRDETNIYKP